MRQRLYLTRGDRVDVLALPSGELLGSIPNTLGVHGVAFAQSLKLGFTSNGKANSVTVFDLDSLRVQGDIALAGKNPDAILYEEAANKLYVFNGSSDSVDVIDLATRKVVTSLQASGRPEFAASNGQGKVYFNIEDHPGINVIDTATDKIVAKWPLAGCEEPTGLAIDARHSRLFSACRNGLMAVTDSASGKRVAQFAIGEHPDAVIFDAETATVLTSAGGGAGGLNITQQVDADHYVLHSNLVTEKGAKTMAMNDRDKTVYLPTAIGGKFIVLVAKPSH